MPPINPKKVIVIGEAKSGKSTLLNALLGTDLLPTNVLQCTKKIIQLSFAEDYSVDLILANGTNINLQGHEAVKSTVHSVGAVNEKYRGLPINILEDFLYDNQGKFEEPKILRLLKSIRNQNYLNYPLDEYKSKVRQFLADNKKHWDKKVTMMKVNGPFPNRLFSGVTLIDTPGLGAEGDLGDITNQYIEEADALLLVKSITGMAAESSNFKQLMDQISTEYPNKLIILAFTRSADMNADEVNRIISHTSKVYPNIMSDCIVAVDGKAQHYVSRFEDMDYELIKESIMLEAQSGSIENFVFAALMKSKCKKQFIGNLKKQSNIGLLKNRIFQILFWDCEYEIPSEEYMIIDKGLTYQEVKDKVLLVSETFSEIIQNEFIEHIVTSSEMGLELLFNGSEKIKKDQFDLNEALLKMRNQYQKYIEILKHESDLKQLEIKDPELLDIRITLLEMELEKIKPKRKERLVESKRIILSSLIGRLPVDEIVLISQAQDYKEKLEILQNEQNENEKLIMEYRLCWQTVFKLKIECEKINQIIMELNWMED